MRSGNIVRTLKSLLRQSGITYRELAERIGISESAVKQMFAAENFTLRRLDEICEVLSVDYAELVEEALSRASETDELGLELEQELVSDIRLLLMAYCLVNHWRVEDILARYAINETEATQLLSRLDRMKLIELLPGNRIRLLVSNSFKWQPDGPIERFFRSQVQGEFFRDDFQGDGAVRLVKNGDLTRASQRLLVERIQGIGQLFDDINREERRQPYSRRQGTTMILALRNWQFTVFSNMERDTSGAPAGNET